MTRIEGYRQAALRDGELEADVDRRFKVLIAQGALPPGATEEIPPGEEEAFILQQLETKRLMKNAPPERLMALAQALRQQVAKN